MTSHGNGPINAIHKAIHMLCLGWNPIKSFLSEYLQRASRWAPSGNKHKSQISCVSTFRAKTRQEHENLHAQPFNWAQRKHISTATWQKRKPTSSCSQVSSNNPHPLYTSKKSWDPFTYMHRETTNWAPRCHSVQRKHSGHDFKPSQNSVFPWPTP